MFTDFNDAARLVMRLAEVTADARRRGAVDTQDMLLALAQLHDCVAARVLRRAGIDLEAVRREIAKFETAETDTGERSRRRTPGVVKAVERARSAAYGRLGHETVGTGHLLLGLLEEANGVASRVLVRLKIGRLGSNLSRVAEHVVAEMEGRRS